MKTRAEYMAAYRKRKSDKGLCIYGGCWEKAIRGLQCVVHADANLNRERRQRLPKTIARLKEALAQAERKLAHG